MPFPTTNPALARALQTQGYEEPTPVQLAVLEQGSGDQDLLVSAQTGSGKTVAYGLAFASTLLDGAERFERADGPRALIVAPTRELAMQVHRELSWLYKETDAVIVSCVGGMDPRREQRQLAQGCHIVVGTPGRLRDHMERSHLDVSGLKVLVLDEADEMLDLGFREDLEFMLDATPESRRTLLFSATLARDIVNLAKRYQRDAVRIDTIDRNEPHGDIEYRALRVAPNEVEHAVVNVLRLFESRSALVFCGTREAVKHLHGSLAERGFSAVSLSGELSQNERTHALQALRDGRARVCVATDVAARGLDLPNLDLVIHADMPVNKAGLLHRSGRTGRAGRKGVSVVLVPYNRRRRAEQLLETAGVDVTWGAPPTAEEIRKRDQERMLQDPVLTEEPAEEDLALAEALLAGRSAQDIAAALIRIYRSRLPAPEDLFDGAASQEPARERPVRTEQRGPQNTVWFRLNVGDQNNANPKWLIPLICRTGHVVKDDIGAIRIFDRETKFEISTEAADRFMAAVNASTDGNVRIQPAGPPGPADKRSRPFSRGPKPGARPSNDRGSNDRAPYQGSSGERPSHARSGVDQGAGERPGGGWSPHESASGAPAKERAPKDRPRADNARTDPPRPPRTDKPKAKKRKAN